jgi:hypothetical protein
MNTASEKGFSMILVLTISSIVMLFLVSISIRIINESNFARIEANRDQALHIAEAGVNYYAWYLNHFNDDFSNGQPEAFPITFDFTNSTGEVIGSYTLEMEEPLPGSTIGTIISTGRVVGDDMSERTVRAQIGLPSIATYSFVSNSDAWFGPGETIDGRSHFNGGVRMDGTVTDVIASAKETYICQTFHGCADEEKPGVWGVGGPSSFFEFPVSPIDYDQISGSLSNLEGLAKSAEGHFFDTNNKYYGYHIELLSNNTADPLDDTYKLYGVKKVFKYTGYTGDYGNVQYTDDPKKWEYIGTYPVPTNGVIFVDHDLWIHGETSSNLTIGAGHFPEGASSYRSIVIYDDLTYYDHSGDAGTVGLMAQKDIRLPRNAPSDLQIDAVLLAQKGAVIYPDYNTTKSNITTYGGIMTNLTWTWSWVNASGTVVAGYENTYSSYDPHLTYAPPPFFPDSGQYSVLKWEEVKLD